MRKQFDLQDWLKDKSQRVETRDGRPVRIVCWDRNGDYPIMALATEARGNESYITCLSNGRKTIHSQEFPSDLFIVTPEPELTEWEKAVGRAIAGFQLIPRDKDGMQNIHDVDAFIKKNASELLSLARKEIQDELIKFKVAAETGYNMWREDGKAEVLKDLPRCEDIKTGDRVLIHCKSTRDEALKHIYDNQEGKVLHIWDLKRNPWGNIHVKIEGGYSNGFLLEELEKLPGFKEDEK